MNEEGLHGLADAAGVAGRWKDAFGHWQDVSDDTIRAVLGALDLPAESPEAIRASREKLRGGDGLLPLVTADAGGTVVLPCRPGPFLFALEDGGRVEGRAEAHADGAAVRVPDAPGYHRLEIDGHETVVAAAPARAYGLGDAMEAAGRGRDEKAWGLATQLYSLRRPRDGGLGDVAALATLARRAASHGAQALSISPVHAQFSADPDRFSPYAPSSRVMRNVLHAAIDLEGPEAAALEADALVDWPRAGRLRLERLRRMFATRDEDERARFSAWRGTIGEAVELHARFEALHRHHFEEGRGVWHWREWPESFRDPASSDVARFAAAHADEVEFHAWLQYRIALGLEAAQKAAKDAGMAVGLVSDLAVGTDSGGSHCWSRQAETLIGLSIGAPPDLLSREGQNWGITAFAPHGLRTHGFRAFIEMLQAALTDAGGVRIDHAMGLNRLWVIPDGGRSADGAYLALPEEDLLRLVRLESLRHKAVVLGEDLGTVPEGFTDRLQRAGIDGMRVMWFERDEHRFKPPREWTRGASAMTSTHDLPTVAGWWRGRDIDWNERLGRDTGSAREERETDRVKLWDAMRESGAGDGEMPAPLDGIRIADVAAAHVGRAGSELVMLPLEDALALEEAPNVPGTTDEHPNWRRRLEQDVDTVLDAPHVATRLAALDAARRQR